MFGKGRRQREGRVHDIYIPQPVQTREQWTLITTASPACDHDGRSSVTSPSSLSTNVSETKDHTSLIISGSRRSSTLRNNKAELARLRHRWCHLCPSPAPAPTTTLLRLPDRFCSSSAYLTASHTILLLAPACIIIIIRIIALLPFLAVPDFIPTIPSLPFLLLLHPATDASSSSSVAVTPTLPFRHCAGRPLHTRLLHLVFLTLLPPHIAQIRH